MSATGSTGSAPGARVKPGDVIAEKYEVERVLASGGMGVVLAAQHKQLRRRVALKFLLPELCATNDVVERFLREAQAMTTIQSEHVARVLDVGTTADGSPYMVMEYLEGEDLSVTLARRRRLDVEEAVDFVLQAMEAIAEAHVHGFVHRDLKPSNLFVTRRLDGSPLVKVLDFGISKVIAKDMPADLTRSHGMLGSPLYMAPEQIRSSKTVDTRADIWTLGVILHELVSGTPPFQAESVPAVLAAIIADDPASLQSVRPDVPAGLSDVVRHCLRRERTERYDDVAELAVALRPFASRDGAQSVERIERIVARHKVGAKAKTAEADAPPPKSVLSPFAQTAAAPESAPRGGESDRGVAAAAPSGASGSSFGKYRLLAMLGSGSITESFLGVVGASQTLGSGKLVVIKRLRPNLAEDPEFVSMLVDEARIAATLSHPNVIQTYEVGEVGAECYLAMEYLDGQPLDRVAQRVQGRSAVPLAMGLAIVQGMLAGLHAAHEASDVDGSPLGLVHRDVTPRNVFVTYDGQVKVVDFALAKAKGRATETRQGVVKGRAGYMAPEQAAAGSLDRRADVFSAGVVLYELLAGRRMWKGVDDGEIMRRLLAGELPGGPRDVNPQVPKALDSIARRALSRDKDDRFATAREFSIALERAIDAENLRCTPRELGDWLAERFAERRRETRKLIDEQLAGGASPSARGPRAIDLSEQPRVEDVDAGPPDASSSPIDPVMAQSHPGVTTGATTVSRSASRWAFVGGLALVAIGAGALVIASAHERERPEAHALVATSEAPPTSSPPPVPSPLHADAPSATTTATPPAAEVRVSVTTSAPGAELTIDDEAKLRTPVAVSRPRDGHAHRLTIHAPGFRPETRSVTFDEDVTWAPQLVPVRAVASGAAPVHSATATATAAAATSPSSSASVRKKRELDDNPYAGQNE